MIQVSAPRVLRVTSAARAAILKFGAMCGRDAAYSADEQGSNPERRIGKADVS